MIFLVPFLELSVGDVGDTEGGDVVLTTSLSVKRVGGSVYGAASTGRSLGMSPELSVKDMGKAALGARLATVLSFGGVDSRALNNDAPSTRLPLQLSVGTANGGVGRLFSTVFRKKTGLLSVSLAAVTRQLPRSPLRDMPFCFCNDPSKVKEGG